MAARKNASVDELVLEYAYSLFAKKGADSASLSDIAAECGISKGTLYYYYPSRENLVSICAEACVKFMSDAIIGWAESLSQESDIEIVCSELAMVFSGDREDVRLMLSLFHYNNDGIRQLMAGALKQWRLMLEVGALRLDRRYSERFSTLASAVLYMLIGIAAAGESRESAKEKLLEMLNLSR